MGMSLITQYYCSSEAGAFNSHERHDEGEKREESGGLTWLSKKEMSVEIDLFSLFSRTLPSIRFPPGKSMSWLTVPLLNESLPDKYKCHVGLSQTNSGPTQWRYSIQPLFYFLSRIFISS